MSVLLALAVVLSLAACALGAWLVALRLRAPRVPPPLADPPAVDVLLPVRDEEANLAAIVERLAAQSTPISVAILDDGSVDRTAAIAREVTGRDRRFTLHAVPPPASGRSGKIRALELGSGLGAAEWILAIDADARPAPDALARALAAARHHGLDALSLAARQRVGSIGEALLTPLVFALLDALLGDWRAVACGEGPPVANGQFFLVRREALAKIGGYATIAAEPLDDVALARRLAAGGFRVGFWRAGAALEVRMYVGLRASFRGWRRNLALILGERPGLVAGAALLPLLPAIVASAALATSDPAAAAIAWSAGIAASALARAGTGSSPLWAALYPLDAITLAACLALARRDRARGRLAAWRGRQIDP